MDSDEKTASDDDAMMQKQTFPVEQHCRRYTHEHGWQGYRGEQAKVLHLLERLLLQQPFPFPKRPKIFELQRRQNTIEGANINTLYQRLAQKDIPMALEKDCLLNGC
jgi:hypothetical protein